MRWIYIIILFHFILSINAQDTITVQTFNWANPARRGAFQFPQDPTQSYRKILMEYNMRCHNAAVGTGSVGCYEWDYSCNTFITDSSRVDSLKATNDNYIVAGNTETSFEYQYYPMNSIYETTQKNVSFGAISNEIQSKINSSGNTVFKSTSNGMRMQVLLTQAELLAAGVKAGKISGINLSSASGGRFKNLKIKCKSTNRQNLTTKPELKGFSTHYYIDTDFAPQGSMILYFYDPFIWDGTSSLILDISYNNEENDIVPDLILSSDANTNAIVSSQTEKCMIWDGVSPQFKSPKLSNFSDEITISFWLFGTPQNQPTNGSVLEGLNPQKLRSLNIHLPWSNGSIYFDCGNLNGSVDRIEKAATVSDYEADWNHWTFTKNATTGIMRIYKNGSLWQSATGKTNAINIDQMALGEALSYNGVYFGRMKEFAMWNKELDSTLIQEWMHKDINSTHPEFSNLQFYYKFEQSVSNSVKDHAQNPQDLLLPVAVRTYSDKAERNVLNFTSMSNRPLMSIVQGTYGSTNITNIAVRDSVPEGPRKVQQYSVQNNNLVLDSVYYLYRSGIIKVYAEDGTFVEDLLFFSDGLFLIDKLKYHRKIPAKYELVSLVTPYGNNLDLGKSGKTFIFDVTDFEPILKGQKFLSMEMGGENQEEIDIKFHFIKGTPERKVMDIRNIWPFERGVFADILNNNKFEARSSNLNSNAKYFNIRMSITGHEQNGEFTNRRHFVNVQGKSNNKFSFNVWKECGLNPIYPQGGTWIFDRAGWCPGAPTDLHRFDITPYVGSNAATTIDYGVDPPQLDQANYLVSSQLVSYGEYNFTHDAALVDIMRPSSGRVEFERMNPSCNTPKIRVRNSGSATLTSLKIKYGRANGLKENYTWTGNLSASDEVEIDLPITQPNFWVNALDTNLIFEVELSDPNGNPDQNKENNFQSVAYKNVESFPPSVFFEFRTNSKPTDNAYRITNSSGTTIVERTSMTAATTYRDELKFAPGCYTLEVTDSENDGLAFWYFPNYGNGSARIVRKLNATAFVPVKAFISDFGGGFQYDFTVTEPVGTNDANLFELFAYYPNPVEDVLNLDIQNSDLSDLQISILDPQGKILQQKKQVMYSGINQIKIHTNELVQGIYFVKIQQSGKTKTVKFVKQ